MNPQSQKTLSVIVPAFDAARFIEPCLRSILAQLEPQHALVMVDDGSRDDTHAVAERLRDEFAHADFTLIRQPNQGIAGARNRGLAAAAGQYLLFVDADDLLEPGALLALDAVAKAHQPDVIACDFNAWRPDKQRKSHRVSLGYPPNTLMRDRDEILLHFFADRHMYVWANVFRREVYERVPQPVFPLGRVFEDVSVLSHLLARCDSLYHLARPIIDYRQHAASLKRAVSAKWCVDFVSALQQVKHAFSTVPASDAVRMHIDATACHFYIGIVKNSYQLPWREGRAVRDQIRQLFLDSLFHYPLAVLAAMENGALQSRDSKADVAAARQARKALEGDIGFAIAKTASRKIKLWQRMVA
ncbi:MAG: glycosyltransferase family 2 protein [Massilia sp.]